MSIRESKEIKGSVLGLLKEDKVEEPVGGLKELNQRQKLCLEKIAQGYSQVESAKMAGYKCNDNYSCSSVVSKLVSSPEGKAYLNDIRRPSFEEAKDISGVVIQTYMNQVLFNIKNIVESENYDVVIDKDRGIKITKTNFFLKKRLSEFTDAELAGVTSLSSKNGSIEVKWDRNSAMKELGDIIGIKNIAVEEDINEAFRKAKLNNLWGEEDDKEES